MSRALGCNHSRCCVFTGFFPWWHRDCAAAKLGLHVLHGGDGVVAPASDERAAPVQGARHVGGAATESGGARTECACRGRWGGSLIVANARYAYKGAKPLSHPVSGCGTTPGRWRSPQPRQRQRPRQLGPAWAWAWAWASHPQPWGAFPCRASAGRRSSLSSPAMYRSHSRQGKHTKHTKEHSLSRRQCAMAIKSTAHTVGTVGTAHTVGAVGTAHTVGAVGTAHTPGAVPQFLPTYSRHSVLVSACFSVMQPLTPASGKT